MKILILNRHPEGKILGEAYKRGFSYRGYNVDFLSKLNGSDLAQYCAVLAHPVKEDFLALFDEAIKRKDFKLIFSNTGTLKEINSSSEFENNNVFFTEFLGVSDLIKIIES